MGVITRLANLQAALSNNAGILTLLDDVQPASYKGAPFLVNVVGLTGGRKTAVHKFPNSNIQNVEDLGLNPRNYKITAIINEPNYRFKRDKLLAALESEGTGILIHPTFGQIENMVALSFTMVEDLKKAGDLEIIIDFAPSESSGLPVETANTLSKVEGGEKSVFESIEEGIGEFFKVTNELVGNYQAAQSKLNQFVSIVETNTKSRPSTTGRSNEFNQSVSNFQSSINRNINQPTVLAKEMADIFKAMPDLYDNPKDKLSVQSLFFTFGDDDIEIPQTTVSRIERKNNNDLINDSVKAFSLSQAYTSAAQIDFNTIVEIEGVENQLEVAFKSVKSSVLL